MISRNDFSVQEGILTVEYEMPAGILAKNDDGSVCFHVTTWCTGQVEIPDIDSYNWNGIEFDSLNRPQILNFGCLPDDIIKYLYIEIAIEIGILLASKAVDFVVTGCSSGQGMMLACNNMPGVICGCAPTPKDAYLFAQINNGNAISLPLGEEYTYSGSENCKKTIEMIFCEPFGQGYPKDQSARKISDAKLLKSVKEKSQIDFITLLERLDDNLITKALQKKNVVDYVLNNGTDITIINWIKQHI